MVQINFRQLLEQKKGQLQQLQGNLEIEKTKLSDLKTEREKVEQAQIIIQKVAKDTQEQLKYQLSELVTLALASVFDDPYEFVIDFQQRKNQTEADIYFTREGEKVDPMTSTGGGPIDVSAFGLRLSLWTLKKDRSRPIIILDEPVPRLKGKDANIRFIQLVKEVNKELNVQIIMVSDERIPMEEIEAGADAVHRVTMVKTKGKYSRGVSKVETTIMR